ncbi:MAG TPA: RidA family protein [Caulobacteraceae bacterium]|jgi:enamine deaminase RidA (YjgF/YER057c/UK114 family)
MTTPADRLAALNVILPVPVAPVANYLPYVRVGSLVHISGQVSVDASGGIRGVVGEDLNLAAGQAAARLCGINLISQFRAACDGELSRVVRVVRLGGFVQAGRAFFDIPKVLNGCSDLMVDVFGEAGRHARSAVGVYRLPLNFAVEADAVIEVR